MVEFALTAPIVLFLMLGVVELGHGLNSYLTVLSSARDAARMGSQIGISDASDLTTLRTLITNETGRLSSAPIPTTTNCPAGEGVCISTSYCSTTVPATCSTTGLTDKWINVKVCYDHPLIIGIPWLLDDEIPICSATKMRIAQ